MKLANTLLNLYEAKYDKEVGSARPSSRSDSNVSDDVELKANYRMVFDFTQFRDFELNDDMDISAWIDDVIHKSKLEKKIDEMLNRELLKHKWFTEKFDSVDAEIESIENGEKVASLGSVAVNIKLVFRASVSLNESQIGPALTGIIPTLNGEMKLAGSLLDADSYKA